MERIKVMLVDDDRSIRELVNIALPDERFEKFCSETGADAIRMFPVWAPDVVMLDIYLPDITGVDVLKHLLAMAHGVKPKFIMLTSISNRHEIMNCIKLGVSGYVIKPFDAETLQTQVMKYL